MREASAVDPNPFRFAYAGNSMQHGRRPDPKSSRIYPDLTPSGGEKTDPLLPEGLHGEIASLLAH